MDAYSWLAKWDKSLLYEHTHKGVAENETFQTEANNYILSFHNMYSLGD